MRTASLGKSYSNRGRWRGEFADDFAVDGLSISRAAMGSLRI